MENSIYLGLSRQMALRTNMDIIANNIANMSTPGYRGQNLLFEEYLSGERGTDSDGNKYDPLSFVNDRGEYQITAPGAVKVTSNPFDIYLAGPGFMGVVGPDGEISYTRAGNLTKNVDGTLLTASGHEVASAGGGAIVLPQNSTEFNVDDKGFVSNQDGVIGQIMVKEFANLQYLKPQGDNLYTTDAPAVDAENTVVKQAMLEGSNVKPVIEMTRMIDTLRSFQSVQNVLQTENERLRTAIQRLTRQG
jgi:flagellar basal-body rod protein FlgF